MKRYLKIFLLVTVSLSILSCSATTTSRSFKEQWRDSMTTSRVKWKLARDNDVSSSNIDVQTWRGVVTMVGHVKNIEEKARAELVAMDVQGVTGVKNYIEVAGEDSAQTFAKDTVIEEKPLVDTVQPAKEAPKKIANKKITPKAVSKDAKDEMKLVVAAKKEMKEDLFVEPAAGKRQNGVSYEISKEFAQSGIDTEMPPEEDITRQALEELKALKARKGK
ncbi:MAG: hypothetical protein COV46_06785 [Deltaproteobacteria bacterium CG11_big_fil_rev_8_21_14_0_20_49_13]|nr:MAG: hypothetical protein COV46_06785 [Deltaproteobacteria bacterium CG11_big_fil_rev_8_21_14_0_20_49_13]